MNDLKKLVILAQNGDQEAYRVFLEAISETIKKIVSYKIFNEGHREDICQEILISVHTSLSTYGPERPIMPWINCIIERRIIDYIRKYSKLNEREGVSLQDVTNLEGEANKNIENLASVDQLNSLIEKYLSEELRKPLILAKIEGHQTKDIADMLGISESATRTRISRALNKLKKAVGNRNHGK